MTTLPAAYPTFEAIRETKIPSLDMAVAEYRHKVTGAIHYHLASPNTENVFLVALRTMPMDSTGVAHILEHTALCGSKKYPVRDPFFLMIRRSLNTFMNAFTSSDWTAYPFASQNRKDFDNLLSVYLDAVFFANLNPLDFLQEGIRVEFSQPNDKSSPLVYKGVVFNEMKGAMSSVHSELWEALNSQLFPTTTYHYNSGGDPAVIPQLSYDDLVAFYKEHYHPSNAVFMTYGDIPAVELQERFEKDALHSFKALPEKIRGKDEQRYSAPHYATLPYAFNEDDTQDKTHMVMAWLLGKTANLKERFEAELLSGVLLENSASPLRHFLETFEHSQAPSPLCGVDDNGRELSFMCGIEGTNPEYAAAFEAGVLAVLQNVAEKGVPVEDVEAVLHQLELSHREIGGGGYPYGMQLILGGLGAVLHDGDPMALWDVDVVLAELKEAIKDPQFIPSLSKKWLLQNTHRVQVILQPDTQLSARRLADESAKLAAIHEHLTADQADTILQETAALQARQDQKDDPELLPCVGREDIPAEIYVAEGQSKSFMLNQQSVPLTTYAQGTNGLLYEQVVIDVPAFTEEEESLLSLYTRLVSELGAGGKSYLEMQQWQSRVSGGLSMSLSMRPALDDTHQAKAYFIYSGKALHDKCDAFTELMRYTLEELRFDERDRVRDIVARKKLRLESGITGNGHALALAASSASFGVVAAFNQRHSGLQGTRFIRALDEDIANDEGLDRVLAVLQSIHQKILASNRQFLLVGEESRLAGFEQSLQNAWQASTHSAQSPLFQFKPTDKAQDVAWLVNTQVQFCARSFAAVPVTHPDSSALVLLGGVLKNGYLHSAIREKGGAYGSGAGYDAMSGSFRFHSYRDPRLGETLDDFKHSVDWLLNNRHEQRQLDEALLGVISSADKPLSPAGEAKSAFHHALYGRTPEHRRRMRERLLAVSLADIQRVGEKYLTQKGVTAVVAPSTRLSDVEALNLTVERL